MNYTVTILNEEFENDKTGEKVQGITIIGPVSRFSTK